MSRIAVVTSNPPFAEGGHLVLARSLVHALDEAGHEAALVLTPQNRFGRQAAAYLATRLTDVGLTHDGHTIDQVISLRFPSYAVRHPAHVCWLNHRMREYYDLWERFIVPLSWRGLLKERVRRRVVHVVDRYLLTRNTRKLLVLSRTVQARLQRFGAIPSSVLYPPPPQRPYRCDRYGDFIFAVSRLTPLKRMDLVIRALARPEAGGARAVIAGDGDQAPALRALISELGLDDRVSLVGPISEAQLIDYLATCRAVCFPPLNEDYGFVTVEAFASAKALITCHDSGAPTELVNDGVQGLLCDPDPAALAPAIRRLLDDETLAARLGAEGQRAVAAMTWDRAVRELVIV
jgi:glycosyltransferase involved in cell wall biosynthesis